MFGDDQAKCGRAEERNSFSIGEVHGGCEENKSVKAELANVRGTAEKLATENAILSADVVRMNAAPRMEVDRGTKDEEASRRYPFVKVHADFLVKKCSKAKGQVIPYPEKGERGDSPVDWHDAYILMSECGSTIINTLAGSG